MGLFLALSGIADTTSKAVISALNDYATSRGGTLKPAKPAAENHEILIVTAAPGGGVTVYYPGHFNEWDDASEYLSAKLDRPVFSFHIHDGDFWMYIFFVKGREVDRFNPLPDYWEELDKKEKLTWAGNASTIAKYWPGSDANALGRYLVTWDVNDDNPAKAHSDDEYAAGTDWQLADFMRRLGLVYPIDEKGKPQGQIFAFDVR